jgi:hypothetical protein
MNWMKMPDNVRAFFQRQGKIGADKRKAVLTPERRTEIARQAAQARWAKRVKEPEPQSTESQEETE